MMNNKAVEVRVARDVMVTSVKTLGVNQTLHEAIEMLLVNQFSGAPVVDSQGRLIGMLSEKDCIEALVEATRMSGQPLMVADAMTRYLMRVTEDTPLLTIAQLFIHHPFRRLPVVRHGLLVGQISRRDLLRGMCSSFEIAASPALGGSGSESRSASKVCAG